MANSSVRSGCVPAARASLLAGSAIAQEKAQKGVSVGAREGRGQIDATGPDLRSILRRLERRGDANLTLSARQVTGLFAGLRLTRAETKAPPAPCSRLDKFAMDGDRRLTRSECADYAERGGGRACPAHAATARPTPTREVPT
jgi:hypothetical protein